MPPVIKVGDQNSLISTSKFELAKFPFDNFNPVQSRILDYYNLDNNLIIASNTSSGKTVVAEMVLIDEIRTRKGKGLYLVPLKALAQEKIDNWTDKLHHFSDLKVSVCTGDYRLTAERKEELEAADLIIMSYEMFNSRIRNIGSERSEFLKKVGTLIADECHLLTVPNRGDHLEAGLMKFTDINPACRIVFLSATLPNVDEIANWVSFVLNHKDTILLKSTYRPCPLNMHYEKYYDGERNYYDNEQQKVNMALEIVEYYPDDKFLIFSHTKGTCDLMKQALIGAGVKCEVHNADLDKSKRIKVEKSFKTDKDLRVIVATSTLAWGCYKYGSLIQMANGVLCPIECINPEDEVLSFNGRTFEPKKVIRVGEKINRKAYRVTLSTGEICEVNKDHIFYAAINRESPNWQSVENLSVGDFLAVPKKYDFSKVSQFSEIGYILGFSAGDGCLSLVGTFADNENKYVLDICAGKDDKDHLLYIKEIISKITDYALSELKEDSNGVLHIVCKARCVVNNFVGNISIGRDKENLSVPQWIQADRIILKSYISGLFDSDGGFVDHCNGNFSLEFSTISKLLARQVQQLLLSFGIRSSVSKKRMKDTIINGRLQLAKRDWIWRVRVYNLYAKKFEEEIGFTIRRKYDQLKSVLLKEESLHNTKWILPVRNLINEHASANCISPTKMCESIGNRAWNIINTKELSYFTVKKILEKFPVRSKLNELFEADLVWSKIKKIELVKGGKFQDIEVEGLHSFVGSGVMSHNCNLPARRVIILGVHRGLDEIAMYDVLQMVGRAGRPAYDPAGDAYVLLPERTYDLYKEKIKKPQLIQSQMLAQTGLHYKVLAFHLVSEIYQENIKNREDVHHWYKRSLAHFQANNLDEGIVDSTMDLLKKYGAVWEEDGKYTVTSVGKIASLFYYSPFDVSDLKRNFTQLFDDHQQDDDLWLSIALGNIDTYKSGIVSKAERDEMSMFANMVRLKYSGMLVEPCVKTAFVYHQMLNGIPSSTLISYTRTLQFDFPRLNQVLQALDGFTGKWGKKQWFNDLQLRINYGVKGPMLVFCQLPHIGKVRATKLWNAGVQSLADVVADPARVRKLTGLKTDKADEVIAKAKTLLLTS